MHNPLQDNKKESHNQAFMDLYITAWLLFLTLYIKVILNLYGVTALYLQRAFDVIAYKATGLVDHKAFISSELCA